MRKASGGFTLIELIVVIVILGILAVTAAPKFIDLQSDARIATINGMKAAVNSAVSLTYGKSLVKAQDKSSTGKITVNGNEVTVCYGYPCATADGLKAVLDIGELPACSADGSGNSSVDWCVVVETNTPKSAQIYIGNQYNGTTAPKCYVKYQEAQGTTSEGKVTITAPVVTIETSEC